MLIHLTYDIRRAFERLEKDEKEEVPGFTIANKLSPPRENKACTAVRKKNINEGSPLICVKDCHNVKRKTITAGKKTNHNNPRKCLLYHGPFHFAFTSSPHILLSGRRTT